MSRDEGYTLTEMLVVIAVIGMIAAALTPAVFGQMNRARAKSAELLYVVRSFETAGLRI